jgi:hypothetical protein
MKASRIAGAPKILQLAKNSHSTQNPQGLVLFVLCPTPVISHFSGGCSTSQNGHAKASSPFCTLRRSFSSTLCLGHFSSAMLVVYLVEITLDFELHHYGG